MNVLKIFRKKSFVLTLAVGYLAFSCSQYDLSDHEFDYTTYENYLGSGLFIDKFDNTIVTGKKSPLEEARIMLAEANKKYGTDIKIQDHVLLAMVTLENPTDIEQFLLSENMLNRTDLQLVDVLITNIQNDGLDTALKTFEKSVIDLDISKEEFDRYNLFGNALKILESEKPGLFDSLSSSQRGVVACIVSYVLWVLSLIAAAAACLGPQAVFFCVAAMINLVAATIETATNCAGYM